MVDGLINIGHSDYDRYSELTIFYYESTLPETENKVQQGVQQYQQKWYQGRIQLYTFGDIT